MTTSMRSAESISVAIWCPTRGSPGALVRSVVSRSGMSGAPMLSVPPPGSRATTARRTCPARPATHDRDRPSRRRRWPR